MVVGAGLAGLTAADELARAGASVRVLESRSRVGGRIWTVAPEGPESAALFDLGATWVWADQEALLGLAAELGVETYAQHREGRVLAEIPELPPHPVEVPPASPAELRFAGGAQTVCERLAARLPTGSLTLGATVETIADEGGRLAVLGLGPDGELALTTDAVVVALPPRLALDRVAFEPGLPADVVSVMTATPTWMGRALKAIAVYDRPFWRDDGSSGLAFSTVGPLIEVHDACSADGSVAALWGLVSEDHAFRDLDGQTRAEQVLDQLARLFGPQAAEPRGYFERDWSQDPNTADRIVWLGGELLGYGHPAFAQAQFDGRLAFAGAETEAVGGGHMEAAVRSGRRAAHLLLLAD